MADLHPTKTRLELLRGVRRREVTGYADYDGGLVEYYWDGEGKGRQVTRRMEELIRAGWVAKGSVSVGDQSFPTYSMRLSAAGAAVLDDAADVGWRGGGARAGCREHRPEEQDQQR